MTALAHPTAVQATLISVVVAVYNESANINPMFEALDEEARRHSDLKWEFIFVDDGSTDDTFARIAHLTEIDRRFKAVQLSRNFGAHTATSAGLQFASGDAAVAMSGDLQDHPREISAFITKWREGFHVVWGLRVKREERLIDQIFSRCFALLIRHVALPNYPTTGTGGFWLIDRLVIDALNSFKERNQVVSGLILFSGFRQTHIEYKSQPRRSGRSKFSLRRKLHLTIDYIVSFSMMPIRLASLGGLGISILAFLYMAYQIVSRLLYGTTVPGFTQSIVLLLMLGGLQLAMLGVLGEYLWRTLDDARRRPLFFVQSLRGDFPSYGLPLPPTQPRPLHETSNREAKAGF